MAKTIFFHIFITFSFFFCLKFKITQNIFISYVFIYFYIFTFLSSPYLDTICARLLDSAPSHQIEIFRNYFVVKPLKICQYEGSEIPIAFFFWKVQIFADIGRCLTLIMSLCILYYTNSLVRRKENFSTFITFLASFLLRPLPRILRYMKKLEY